MSQNYRSQSANNMITWIMILVVLVPITVFGWYLYIAHYHGALATRPDNVFFLAGIAFGPMHHDTLFQWGLIFLSIFCGKAAFNIVKYRSLVHEETAAEKSFRKAPNTIRHEKYTS